MQGLLFDSTAVVNRQNLLCAVLTFTTAVLLLTALHADLIVAVVLLWSTAVSIGGTQGG